MKQVLQLESLKAQTKVKVSTSKTMRGFLAIKEVLVSPGSIVMVIEELLKSSSVLIIVTLQITADEHNVYEDSADQRVQLNIHDFNLCV